MDQNPHDQQERAVPQPTAQSQESSKPLDTEAELQQIPQYAHAMIDAAIVRNAHIASDRTEPFDRLLLNPEDRHSTADISHGYDTAEAPTPGITILSRSKATVGPEITTVAPQDQATTASQVTTQPGPRGKLFRPARAVTGQLVDPLNEAPGRRPEHQPNIPPAENCSLFLTNLPKDCTAAMLIKAIESLGRVVGRIYHVHISPADPTLGHSHAAAKIVFFKRPAARALMQRCAAGSFEVGGQQVRAQWNRYMESPDITTDKPLGPELSRVVTFAGPKNLCDREVIKHLLDQHLVYQVVQVRNVSETADERCLEWHFAGYHPQAMWAKRVVEDYMPGVKTAYGRDPCDVFGS